MDPADYMLAICGNASLRELSSPGKSGSLFYLTQDDKYIIKTVKKSEVKVSSYINFNGYLSVHIFSYSSYFLHLAESIIISLLYCFCLRCLSKCFQVILSICASMRILLLQNSSGCIA